MLWLRAKTSVAFDRHLLSYPIAHLKQRCTNKHQKCLHHFLCLYVTESLRNSLSTINSTLFCATAKAFHRGPAPTSRGRQLRHHHLDILRQQGFAIVGDERRGLLTNNTLPLSFCSFSCWQNQNLGFEHKPKRPPLDIPSTSLVTPI